MTSKSVSLVPVTKLPEAAQMSLRELRNEEGVRRWMYTDHVISPEEHRIWLRRLTTDDRQIVFAVVGNERQPLGQVSVTSIDRKNKRADWAYYLSTKARGGLGSAIEYAAINFVFDTLGLKKLNCEVIEGNESVVRLHKKFLFREEGFRRSNIVKNDCRLGVHFLGLTIEEWAAGKAEVRNKYRAVLDKFSVSIDLPHLLAGAQAPQ